MIKGTVKLSEVTKEEHDRLLKRVEELEKALASLQRIVGNLRGEVTTLKQPKWRR